MYGAAKLLGSLQRPPALELDLRQLNRYSVFEGLGPLRYY